MVKIWYNYLNKEQISKINKLTLQEQVYNISILSGAQRKPNVFTINIFPYAKRLKAANYYITAGISNILKFQGKYKKAFIEFYGT